MAKVLNKRGTRSEINSAATANGLNAGEVYLITDENRIAMGTSANTYESYAKESEAGGGGGETSPTVALSITAANLSVNAVYTRIPPRDYEINGTVIAALSTDKWTNSIGHNDGTITSLSFNDLTGISGSLQPNSMNALTTLLFPELKFVESNIQPNAMAVLTSLSFPKLVVIGNTFQPSSMASLTSISLPSLSVVGLNFVLSAFFALTTVSVPNLITIGGNFNSTSVSILTTLYFPSLITIGQNFSVGSMSSLTTLTFPSLTVVGNSFTIAPSSAITTFSFPNLTTIGGIFSISSMTSLTSALFSAIERIATNVTSGNAISITSSTGSLTTFALPTTLKQVGNGGGTIVITSAALNQSSVDNILVRLAALNGTNGTVAFSNRVVTITGTSSTPSATGLAAKSTLVSRGCTVTHN